MHPELQKFITIKFPAHLEHSHIMLALNIILLRTLLIRTMKQR